MDLPPRRFFGRTGENEDILQDARPRAWYDWKGKGGSRVKKEIRTAARGGGPRVEAYRIEGIARPFPNHFHEYYVIGFVEKGERVLSCKNQEYAIRKGDLLLFNPGDSHACVQSDGGTLDYRGLNIPKEAMLGLAEEATGRRELPGFSTNVVSDEETARCLRPLHERMMGGEPGKGESLLPLFSLLIRKYGQPFGNCVPDCPDEVEKACGFMERHYAERVSLDQVCRFAGLSKSSLLRAFVKAKGVTPYRYLENIRVGKAGTLLKQGVPPAEAALRTGFSDQSHFTNYFSRLIGLAPGAYGEIFKDTEGSAHGK